MLSQTWCGPCKAVQTETDQLLVQWASFGSGAAQAAAQTRVGDLAERRRQLASAVTEAGRALESSQVDAAVVREALGQMHALYAHLKPFEQQELIRLLLARAELTERQLVLEIASSACAEVAPMPESALLGPQRFAVPERGAALVPQSVFSVTFPLALASLERRVRDHAQERRVQGKALVAADWQTLLDDSVVATRAALARRMGVSRARVTQVLGAAR